MTGLDGANGTITYAVQTVDADALEVRVVLRDAEGAQVVTGSDQPPRGMGTVRRSVRVVVPAKHPEGRLGTPPVFTGSTATNKGAFTRDRRPKSAAFALRRRRRKDL